MYHKSALDIIFKEPTIIVGEMISREYKEQVKYNQKMFFNFKSNSTFGSSRASS